MNDHGTCKNAYKLLLLDVLSDIEGDSDYDDNTLDNEVSLIPVAISILL